MTDQKDFGFEIKLRDSVENLTTKEILDLMQDVELLEADCERLTKLLNTEIMKRERDHDERPSGMIEEAPLLKRLAFKQSDKYFLTLWADWRNPVQHQTIVDLVERKDEISVINEPYDDSDEAIKHYKRIADELDASTYGNEEPDYELEEHKKEVEELDDEAKRFEADEKALDDWLYENRQETE